MRVLLCALFTIISCIGFAQKKTAIVSGRIIDENENSISGVTISILGKNFSTLSQDSGKFTIEVPASQAFALVFSHSGFRDFQKNFYLSENEKEEVNIVLHVNGKTLENVEVKDDKLLRNETGAVLINPKNALSIPSTIGGVESLIKTLVGSNNELSSQYNVRGGNFDENLVYINDFEIYRPYLVSSGQQEGLSLINPELARNVTFYTGGFAAKYGDKLSSVLDIQYKKPTSFGGSAYISLLEQSLHLEGSSKKNKTTYLVGFRNKSNRNLLSNQPTQGSYLPSASDGQAYITWQPAKKWQLELLGIISTSRFDFVPESVKKTSSVFSPIYSASLGLDVNFEGQERDQYTSTLAGATVIFSPKKNLKLKFLLSRFQDEEKENFDIAGAYLFGDRDFDNSSTTFGQIINPLGAGYYQHYGRNALSVRVYNASHKGSLNKGKNFIQWGTSIEETKITDLLKQFEYQDSTGYSLPYTPGNLSLYKAQNSLADLSIQKYSGFLQDNIHINTGKNDITLQGGIRFNYNSLNKEFLISPRAQASWKPLWKKDVIFKLAAGIYDQPPFYRELRDYNGQINTAIKSQKSVQFVAGADYSFIGKNKSPFRVTSEIYYKKMTDVVPYDIDNVKIRYLGNNNAKAYTAGAEFRFYGELVEDAQSWFSLAFMRSRENLVGDFYYQYKNAAGNVIGASTPDKVIADSNKVNVGYVRRPSDRLITAGLYLEDYLATNKNFKAHVNLIYGSNMSYNIPNSTRFRNGLIIDPYIRADVGLSALLLSEKSLRRSHNPFRGFENIWLSLEIFNIIDRANTISYQLIKDFSNSTYAIPNRLTPRLLNLKLLARF